MVFVPDASKSQPQSDRVWSEEKFIDPEAPTKVIGDIAVPQIHLAHWTRLKVFKGLGGTGMRKCWWADFNWSTLEPGQWRLSSVQLWGKRPRHLWLGQIEHRGLCLRERGEGLTFFLQITCGNKGGKLTFSCNNQPLPDFAETLLLWIYCYCHPPLLLNYPGSFRSWARQCNWV